MEIFAYRQCISAAVVDESSAAHKTQRNAEILPVFSHFLSFYSCLHPIYHNRCLLLLPSTFFKGLTGETP